MANSITEVTSMGWGGRLMNSIKSVLFGVVMFLGSFVLLWWNEGNSIRTATGLTEGASVVVKVSPDQVVSANEGKLVHMSGDVKTDEFLDDTDFNIHVNALKLTRNVDMYQWKEEKEEKEEKKVGGGTETTTTYSYSMGWSSGRINSEEFKESAGHENPDLAVSESTQIVGKATIGAFTLNDALLSSVDDHSPLQVPNLDGTKYKGSAVTDQGVYIGSGSAASPQVGDVRVSFSIVKPGPVSIIAKQHADTFEDWITGTGTTISLLDHGTVSPEIMFKEAQDANTLMTWILRAVGFIVMFIGLSMVFKPFVVLADVLPFLGNLLGVGVGIFSFAVSLLLSSLTIAIAWIFYRPVLGITLLVIGIGAFVLIYRWSKKKKEAKATAQPETANV
jgi:hypothetical protein